MPTTDADWTATHIAAAVRSGMLDTTAAVEASLAAIAERDHAVGAFVVVRAAAARREAAALGGRADLDELALAGVPIAIKDNVDVAGEPTRHGTPACGDTPASADHPVVARLRAAGAVVVGKTHVPELCLWGATDGVFGETRNPWDRTRIAGGSSGGSAAAVAAGMVPLALGNDGMGSIRIPAAACGLFGIKPGPGVVPAELGASSWLGMAENGPLATTVADARLMLSVLAGEPSLATTVAPRRLRIALSSRPPVLGTRVATAWRAAVLQAGQALSAAGHAVAEARPPYRALDALAVGARWTAGTAEDAAGLPADLLQPRTRGHIAFGRFLQAAGFAGDHRRDDWAERLGRFFADHDVLVTPTLAQSPPRVDAWHRRSWLVNVWRDANYAPFPARFNLAGVPAASVPWGCGRDGLPVAVQLVAPRGGEALLLALAAQLESLRPWRRLAPGYEAPAGSGVAAGS